MTDTLDRASIPEEIRTGPQSTSATAATTHHDHHNHEPSSSLDARFSCNICFDAVNEPVVTQCGHLYCWPCLYRWLAPGMKPQERASLGMSTSPFTTRLDESRRVCPVCKSPCSVPTVVPIYVDNNHNDPSQQQQQSSLRRPMNSEQEEEKKESTSEEAVQDVRQQHQHQLHQASSEQGLRHPASSEEEDIDMGLDIDGDDDDLDEEPAPPVSEISVQQSAPIIDNGESTSGLRQRRPRTLEEEAVAAPRRPMPASREAEQPSPSSAAVVPRAPSPPRVPRASLSYGLVLAMHQTLLNATSGTQQQRNNQQQNNNNNYTNNNSQQQPQEEPIPSLHYPDRNNNNNTNNSTTSSGSNNINSDAAAMMMDTDPASTEFLSRLLLGLSLFVLFCLLAF